MMTTEELVKELGEEGALEFAGLLLATYGKKADQAIHAIANAVDRSEQAYIDDVWADNPTYHLVTRIERADSWWTGTACGVYLRFTTSTSLLPARHAVRFAQPCPTCHEV